jgi:hypothetical protein
MMPSTDDGGGVAMEEQEFRALLSELEQAQAMIKDLFLGQARLISLWGLVIGGTVSLFLGGHPEVVVGVPYALFAITVYWRRVNIELATRGRYRKCLEKYLKDRGIRVASWETNASRVGQKLATNTYLTALAVVAFLASWVFAAIEAPQLAAKLGWKRASDGLYVFLTLSFLLTLVGLIVSIGELTTSAEEIERLTTDALGNDRELPDKKSSAQRAWESFLARIPTWIAVLIATIAFALSAWRNNKTFVVIFAVVGGIAVGIGWAHSMTSVGGRSAGDMGAQGG